MRAIRIIGAIAWLLAALSLYPGTAKAESTCLAVSQLEEIISAWEQEEAIHPSRLEALRRVLSEFQRCACVEVSETPASDEQEAPSESMNNEEAVEGLKEQMELEIPEELSQEEEVAPVDFTGSWATYFGHMMLKQSENHVTGTYENNRGKIQGEVSERTLRGKWLEAPSYSEPADGGDLELELSRNGLTFTGKWRTGSQGEWFEGLDGKKQGNLIRQ
jgi:hypothetical protein